MKLCQSTKLKVSVPVSSPIHRQRSPMSNSKPKTFKYQSSKGPREQDFLVQTSILKQYRLCSMPTQENFLQISKRVSPERLDERNTWFDRSGITQTTISDIHAEKQRSAWSGGHGETGKTNLEQTSFKTHVSPSWITDSYKKSDPKHNIRNGRA